MEIESAAKKAVLMVEMKVYFLGDYMVDLLALS